MKSKKAGNVHVASPGGGMLDKSAKKTQKNRDKKLKKKERERRMKAEASEAVENGEGAKRDVLADKHSTRDDTSHTEARPSGLSALQGETHRFLVGERVQASWLPGLLDPASGC